MRGILLLKNAKNHPQTLFFENKVDNSIKYGITHHDNHEERHK